MTTTRVGLKLRSGGKLAKSEADFEFKKQHYQCERCGGTGRQKAGLWDGTGYSSTAGTCVDCDGIGRLGQMETEDGDSPRDVVEQQKVDALRQALIDAEASGDAGPLDFEQIKHVARKQTR